MNDDIFEDLLDGVPPWEYNDNVKMADATPSPMDFAFPVAKEGIEFPPHWAELMEQIRVREEEMKRVILSRRSGESVSSQPPASAVDAQLPPSGYALLPPSMPTPNAFEPPHVPYPHLPFWTAAPLPFSPSVYPVNVLPPNARESLLAPKAPPQPQMEVKKKKRPGRKPKTPGRPRDARGLFTKSPEAKDATPTSTTSTTSKSTTRTAKEAAEQQEQQVLMGKIQELQNQLLESRFESVMLREQLVHSQMELSQLKDRGLVKSTIRGYHQLPSDPMPAAASAAAPTAANTTTAPRPMGGSYGGVSPPPMQSMQTMDAFRVQLDYNQLKSKLRPTNNGHYETAESIAAVSPPQQQPEPFAFVLDENL